MKDVRHISNNRARAIEALRRSGLAAAQVDRASLLGQADLDAFTSWWIGERARTGATVVQRAAGAE